MSMVWGSPVEIERRNRILVSVYAYAYEIKSDPLITDGAYDSLAMSIDLTLPTGNKKMDAWFLENFSEFTGMWIHKHPGLEGIDKVYSLLAANDDFLD